ncbi:long-chain-fatty-acid--CoA ligase [Streptomyces sp.]|uniref:long-chain-fatty-acid--CoA ligase n=1 Tax=Streptomyces sp. TaxID=1931 RepID=UPI002F41606A
MHLTQPLHNAVQRDPERPLTVFGDRTRTAAQSADRVARLAWALRRLGCRPGDRVGILALNSDRYHEILLAVPWAGAALNPVNTRWHPAEIVHALRESETRTLFVDDAFAPVVPALRDRWPGLRTVVFCGEGTQPDGSRDYEDLVDGSRPAQDSCRGGDDVLGVFYTGGTTGEAKGVMLSHRNLMVSALGSLASGGFVRPGACLLHAAPMFHLAGLAAWTAGLVAGATHVIVPSFTPGGVLAVMSEHTVTDVLLVPAMMRMLLDSPDLGRYDLAGVRRIMYGASPITDSLLAAARAAFPLAGFTQAYGMTELAPVATLLLPEEHDDPGLRRSAGRPAPHAEVRIVDTSGAECPRGRVGEITVRGEHVMLGYLDRPQETAAAVRDGWLHTGDLGFMDARGYVHVVDRLKDMIVTGGENVYAAEVENALARHPAVAQCAVVGFPDDQWGETVHAVVVLKDGRTATEQELRDTCRGLIAAYKVPRGITFTDSLPLSTVGKVLKRELRDRLLKPRQRLADT